jgi:hypothetical protein
MREKRSKCGKRRANAQAGGPMFACSRCDAKMAQRSSADVRPYAESFDMRC